MAELDDTKKAAIAAALSVYFSEGAEALPFRPGMFLRQVKGSGAWGRLSRKAFGGSGDYRSERAQSGRGIFGGTRA